MHSVSFTFIKFPKQLLDYSGITDFEKILLSFIISLTQQRGYCFASNNTFAEKLNKHPNSISRSINRLKELGFIEVVFEPLRRIYFNTEILDSLPLMVVNHFENEDNQESEDDLTQMNEGINLNDYHIKSNIYTDVKEKDIKGNSSFFIKGKRLDEIRIRHILYDVDIFREHGFPFAALKKLFFDNYKHYSQKSLFEYITVKIEAHFKKEEFKINTSFDIYNLIKKIIEEYILIENPFTVVCDSRRFDILIETNLNSLSHRLHDILNNIMYD
ncbi:helix-turn-helix domain-containing protein [Candidatus Woesearchaeota archaeon]|nr:helix-turn-helix domain-containing protein [Candidatus Woesearchaeota archaeon]